MHKAISNFYQSLAVFCVILQELHPSWFLNTSTVLLHVHFGLPLFLLPPGTQVNAIFVLLFPYLPYVWPPSLPCVWPPYLPCVWPPYLPCVWPIHLHRLIFMSSDISGIHTRLHSSSLTHSLANEALIFAVGISMRYVNNATCTYSWFTDGVCIRCHCFII